MRHAELAVARPHYNGVRLHAGVELATLAGLVTGIQVNPVTGKLVRSAGDAAVDQSDRAAEDWIRAQSISRWGGRRERRRPTHRGPGAALGRSR